MKLAKRALEINTNVYFLDTLATAYAESGKFEDAIIAQEKAIDILKKGDTKYLIDVFIGRLNLYKDHKPWRDK